MSNPFAESPAKPMKPVKDPFADTKVPPNPLMKQPSNPFASTPVKVHCLKLHTRFNNFVHAENAKSIW